MIQIPATIEIYQPSAEKLERVEFAKVTDESEQLRNLWNLA